jgi:hypothetical protein
MGAANRALALPPCRLAAFQPEPRVKLCLVNQPHQTNHQTSCTFNIIITI